MSHPQPMLRAYLEDGPRAGDTVSVSPEEQEGRPPDRIVVDDSGSVEATRDQSGRPEDDSGTTTYRYSHADLDNGLWVYKVASS